MDLVSDDNDTEDDLEVDPTTVDEAPSPDLVLAVRLKHFFARFAEGQDGILRVSSFMEQRGTELDDLTSRVREKVELYLDEDVDLDALEGLIGHVTQHREGEGLPEQSHGSDEESFEELESILEAIPRGHATSYLDGIFRAIGSSPSDQVLRSSLLVSLVGELEIYVNQVLRACFERTPAAIDDNKSAFTWSEVSAFDSLEEFRDRVTEKAVEKALHGSLSDWLKFFEDKFKIQVDPSAYGPLVTEIFQRRHCIVHYGGSASAQYVQKMADSGVKATLDEPLDVTAEYLMKAADELYGVALSLGWATTHKLISDGDLREDVRDAYVNSIYHLLGDRRYGLARTMSDKLPAQHLSFDQSLIVKVNRWLAFKLDGEFGAVRSEVEAFRTSSLSRRFTMARHALLDEHEDAYRIATAMLEESDDNFPLSHYLTWPLLRGVRRWARANVTSESPSEPAEGLADVITSSDSSPRKEES